MKRKALFLVLFGVFVTLALANWVYAQRFVVSVTGGGCSAATTFIARTSGLSGTESSAYTTLICGMISDGIGCSQWSGSSGTLDVLYIFATNTTTTADLNLCSTSFTASPVNSPTFAADLGYTGDGSTSYVNSNYTASTNAINYAQNSAILFVWSLSNARADSAALIGSDISGTYSYLNPWNSSIDSASHELNDTAGNNAFSPGTAAGLFSLNRTVSTSYDFWMNSTNLGTQTNSSTGVPANVYKIGSGGSTFTNRQFAAAGWGAGLNSTQLTALYTRLQAYLHAVGAV